MINPEGTEGFVPPRIDAKKPPSCWLIGGLGCLIIVILAAIALLIGTYQFLHTKTGKQVASGFGNALQNAEKVGPARIDMIQIHDALVRYQLKTGHYPKTLVQLYPDYLPNKAELHCGLDTNPDPNHVSFLYVQPSSDAAPSTTVLSLKWDDSITIGPNTENTSETISEDLGGQFVMIQKHDGTTYTQKLPSD